MGLQSNNYFALQTDLHLIFRKVIQNYYNFLFFKIITFKEFPPKEIWSLTCRNNEAWGIPGYEIYKHYADPLQSMKDKDQAKGKSSTTINFKDKLKLPKRGSFLDVMIKEQKQFPGPGTYKHCTSHYNTTSIDWTDVGEKERGRKQHPIQRNTYIDEINNTAKKRPVPGVGQYNVTKTQKQIEDEINEIKKRKILVSEKRSFLTDPQFLGNEIPGAGNYQPHGIRKVIAKSLLKPSDWKKKHNDETSLQKSKLVLPDAATYSPEPGRITTFSKLQTQKEKYAKNNNQFGKSVRFPDLTKSKSLANLPTPGPNLYDLAFYWKGKVEKKATNKVKEWNNISKGININIYYEK